MKIIVLGDTHIPKRAKKLPDIVKEECESADLIIHVGDWQTIEVYNDLKRLGKVEGVYGNVDSSDLVEVLPSKKIITINEKRIGIIHGHGKSKTTEKRALSAFDGNQVDCILFGHSHIPIHKYINNTLLFNPGSATDKRKQEYCSYGILTITDEIKAEHVFFQKESFV
ncbi:putative phosphoesterase [Metabacillus crassostreae]|uniref:metallophosphoesterase family protein n=1 Tax=Metabacillus crassostreae TaxID=929098 RepID=UPI00195F1CB8|nr:metallophosphoesterase [Metabacillus crassostreae]MBM7603545.1 putative phosphoesterase [Metabacillus crassostreae]